MFFWTSWEGLGEQISVRSHMDPRSGVSLGVLKDGLGKTTLSSFHIDPVYARKELTGLRGIGAPSSSFWVHVHLRRVRDRRMGIDSGVSGSGDLIRYHDRANVFRNPKSTCQF